MLRFVSSCFPGPKRATLLIRFPIQWLDPPSPLARPRKRRRRRGGGSWWLGWTRGSGGGGRGKVAGKRVEEQHMCFMIVINPNHGEFWPQVYVGYLVHNCDINNENPMNKWINEIKEILLELTFDISSYIWYLVYIMGVIFCIYWRPLCIKLLITPILPLD